MAVVLAAIQVLLVEVRQAIIIQLKWRAHLVEDRAVLVAQARVDRAEILVEILVAGLIQLDIVIMEAEVWTTTITLDVVIVAIVAIVIVIVIASATVIVIAIVIATLIVEETMTVVLFYKHPRSVIITPFTGYSVRYRSSAAVLINGSALKCIENPLVG